MATANIKRASGEAISGNKVAYFFAAKGSTDWYLSLAQQDTKLNMESESNSEKSKFTTYQTTGSKTQTIEFNGFYVIGDKVLEILENAYKSGNYVRVKRVVIDKSAATVSGSTTTYPGKYGHAKVPSLALDETTDGLVKLTSTLNIIDQMKDGRDALDDDDIKAIEDASYAFKTWSEADTVK